MVFLPAFAQEKPEVRPGKDVLVPTDLIAEIESQYIKTLREEDPKDIRTDLQLKMEIPREMLGMKLFFEKKGGRSLEEDVDLEIPAGGGVVDMSSFLQEHRGLFSLRFELGEEVKEEDLAHLKVFYVPLYRRQAIGKDVRGLGCGRFADISRFFRSTLLKDEGLLLTTTNQGYFPVIAGTYVLAVIQATGLKVANLNLEDSRYKNFLCPRTARR
jgi:hypothetical protein